MSKADARRTRHARLRKNLTGTTERPRLCVRRSLHHIYAVLVDDAKGHTLAAASTREASLRDGLASKTNVDAAKAVGQRDCRQGQRGRHYRGRVRSRRLKYHGRVAALADAAREAGLTF